MTMIEIFQAILLGIVEGLTEFLPISSTGHLIVAQDVIGYKDVAELFTVVCQMGAIAAVIWHYRQDLIEKTAGALRGEKKTLFFWRNWIVATIPAGVIGLLFNDALERFVTVKSVAISLIIGGCIIWLIETKHTAKASKSRPQFEHLTITQSIKVGLYQIAALIPGVSRSGATIMGGLLSGLDRVTATAFSFYLSIPIIVLAGTYKLVKEGDKISQITGGSTALLTGVVVSFVSALLAINWLLRYVASNNFKPFAYYRIIAGVVILIALAF